jgi:hypothetical protein
MFTNVSKRSIEVRVLVEGTSGEIARLNPAESAVAIGALRSYRWRRWANQIRMDRNNALWLPAALFFAKQAEAQGTRVREVSLIRRWSDTDPSKPLEPRTWQEYEFFSHRFDTQRR